MVLPYMEWHVTDECVRNGRRCDPECCPVALAGESFLKNMDDDDIQTVPHVDRRFVTVYDSDGEYHIEYACSEELEKWIGMYDLEHNMNSITVVLSIDNGVYVAYIKGEAVLSVGKDIL